jgi:hypothetical protein
MLSPDEDNSSGSRMSEPTEQKLFPAHLKPSLISEMQTLYKSSRHVTSFPQLEIISVLFMTTLFILVVVEMPWGISIHSETNILSQDMSRASHNGVHFFHVLVRAYIPVIRRRLIYSHSAPTIRQFIPQNVTISLNLRIAWLRISMRINKPSPIYSHTDSQPCYPQIEWNRDILWNKLPDSWGTESLLITGIYARTRNVKEMYTVVGSSWHVLMIYTMFALNHQDMSRASHNGVHFFHVPGTSIYTSNQETAYLLVTCLDDLYNVCISLMRLGFRWAGNNFCSVYDYSH